MSDRPVDALRQQGARRDALLERIVAALRADERVLGAWLSGSFGRSEDDEWSDLDLHVAVDDRYFAGFLRDRPRLYAAVGEPILIQGEMPSNNLTLGDAVYQLVYFAGAVMVDWNCGPASKAQKPVGHVVLFEREPFPVAAPEVLTPAQRLEQAQRWTTFFWAMAPIAVKHAARGSTRQAAAQTDLLAQALICVHRLLREERGPRPWLEWLNRPLEPEIDAVLPRTGVEITPAAVLEVISQQCAAMVALHPRLLELGENVHTAMVDEMARLSRIASECIGRGVFPTRAYR